MKRLKEILGILLIALGVFFFVIELGKAIISHMDDEHLPVVIGIALFISLLILIIALRLRNREDRS